MGETLYLECASGISGDMFVGAMLDLGADQKVLKKVLDSLPVDGFRVRISRVNKSGLDACDFDVQLDAGHENHDHDMDYLHGHEVHDHEGSNAEEYSHGEHENGEEHHHHEHRNLAQILHILEHGDMTTGARDLAVKMFRIIAQAEAKAHGLPEDQVHFHEVGAVDSIVDIVAAAVCLDNLGIDQVAIPGLCEGRGTIRCQHGILPVPVPAVANIVEEYGLPLEIIEVNGELVTPTGAAIAAAIRTMDRLPERFVIKKTGLGAGKRSYNRPSILRVMLLEEQKKTLSEDIWQLETNVDDSTGEMLGHAVECLLKAGARDAFFIPAYMKKNRPAYLLMVLCMEKDIERMEQILFRETTTIGIRRVLMQRTVLERRTETYQTTLGEVRGKLIIGREKQRIAPEADSITSICEQTGKAWPDVFRQVQEELNGQC